MKKRYMKSLLSLLLVLATLVSCNPFGADMSENPFYVEGEQIRNSEMPGIRFVAYLEKELYDLKHQLIATQIKLESTEKNLKNAQKDLQDSEKKVIRLEAGLKDK